MSGEWESSAAAWPMPDNLTSVIGLGGGLTWAEDEALCESLKDRFDSETFDYFGVRVFSFVSCEEITDALLRGFSSWADNHGRLSFFSIGRECAAANQTVGNCSLAEVVLAPGVTAPGTHLEVAIEAAESSSISRVTLTFDVSPSTCYYMDSTVCSNIQSFADYAAADLSTFIVGLWGEGARIDGLPLALILIRIGLYLPALFGVFYFLHNVALLMHRSRRTGCAHFLFVLASLSHRWRLITLLFALPPLIDWKMLMPCQNCVAFEAIATHAAGRALGLDNTSSTVSGFAHCDVAWAALLNASALVIGESGSGDPSGSSLGEINGSSVISGVSVRAALDPPGPMEGSTCLSAYDVAAMASRYPDCLAAGYAGIAPVCADARRNIWAFRLTLAILPALSIFFVLLIPAVYCVRVMSRRRVRTLATMLTQAITAEEEAAAANNRSWFHPDRDALPQSDRGHNNHEKNGKGGGKGGGGKAAANGAAGPKGKKLHGQVSSLDSLAAKLRADLRAARAAGRLRRKRLKNRVLFGSATNEEAQPSTWLSSTTNGASSLSSAVPGGEEDEEGGGGLASLEGLLDLLTSSASSAWTHERLERPAAAAAVAAAAAAALDAAAATDELPPAAAAVAVPKQRKKKKAKKPSVDERPHDRRRLNAAARGISAVSRAQRAARALRELSSDVHDGDAAWVEDEESRSREVVALAEATFWHEMAHAVPGLLDLIVTSDAAMRLRIGRALRAACKQCIASAKNPQRSPLLADHGHPRLIGLRYAPLVREVHRPLLLRFLVEEAVEVDELRSRAPLSVVHLAPPPFMGPPSAPPNGKVEPPPLELPEPKQIAQAVAKGGEEAQQGGGGHVVVGYARAPISMAPPKGFPSGARGGRAPAVLPPPTEAPQIANREMLAPQKLSSMTQLLRRVAAATELEQHGAKAKGLADLSSVAKAALRTSKGGGGSSKTLKMQPSRSSKQEKSYSSIFQRKKRW